MSATTSRPRLALWVVTSVLLMMSVGIVGLNVALPSLVRDLDASTAELQWILNSYPLTYAGLLLTGATLGDRFGRVRTLRLGLAAFLVLSVIAAFATSPLTLVLARGAMGAAAAFATPMTLSIATTLSEGPRARSRAIAVWGTMGSIGTALGPVIGGVLLSRFWWGSMFLLNVPLCVVLLVALGRWVPESRDPSPGRFDPIGMVLSFVALTGIVWAIIGAPQSGWTSATTLGVAGASFVTLAVFVMWELHTDEPMLELSYLRNPHFSAAAVASGACIFAFTGMLLVISLLLPSILGLGPIGVGLRLLPMATAMLLSAASSAVVVTRIGTKWSVAFGLTAAAAGAGLLATFGNDSGYGLVLAATVMTGVGIGTGTTQGIAATMGAVPAAKAGVASGFSSSMRQVANILGVAVTGSVLSSAYRSRLGDVSREIGIGAGSAERSRESVAAALEVATRLGGDAGRALEEAARHAFLHGVHSALLAVAVVTAAGALMTVCFVPSRAEDARARSLPAGSPAQGIRANQSIDPSAVSNTSPIATVTNHPVTSRYSVRKAIRDWISR